MVEERKESLGKFLKGCCHTPAIATHPSFSSFLAAQGIPGEPVKEKKEQMPLGYRAEGSRAVGLRGIHMCSPLAQGHTRVLPFPTMQSHMPLPAVHDSAPSRSSGDHVCCAML